MQLECDSVSDELLSSNCYYILTFRTFSDLLENFDEASKNESKLEEHVHTHDHDHDHGVHEHNFEHEHEHPTEVNEQKEHAAEQETKPIS